MDKNHIEEESKDFESLSAEEKQLLLEELFERRSGEERRKEQVEMDFDDRRQAERRQEPQTEIEFGGMTFKGGKIFVLLTALSTLGGAAWGGFEFYKDYMDMREVVQNIDTTEIENRNKLIEQKLDDAIEYSRAIKDDLRDQMNTLDDNVRRVEKQQRDIEAETRLIIQNAEERFENKRDALQNDYDSKASSLRDRSDKRIEDLEDKIDRDLNEIREEINATIRKALDNPLAN